MSAFRKLFDIQNEDIHLNNAGISPVFNTVKATVKQAIDAWASKGCIEMDSMFAAYEQARTKVAHFINTKADWVAFTPNCATAICMVARGLRLNKGDEILTWDNEYSSNAYVWHHVANESGAKVISVAWEKDGSLDTNKLLNHLSSRTKVVALSWIQSQTGYETDLDKLVNAAKKFNALTVIDMIQGLGVKPFDLVRTPADIICMGSHKWLCGPFGGGFLAFGTDRFKELKLVLEGGMSYGKPMELLDLSLSPHQDARRFEPGAYLLWSALGIGAACEQIQNFGVEQIYSQAMGIRLHIIENALKRGWQILGALDDKSTNPAVLMTNKRYDHYKIFELLNQHRISTSSKQLGLRIAPHAFNTKPEIDKMFEIIDNVI